MMWLSTENDFFQTKIAQAGLPVVSPSHFAAVGDGEVNELHLHHRYLRRRDCTTAYRFQNRDSGNLELR